MGLLVPNGPAFAHWSDNLRFASPDGFIGVGSAVVPGASNADGSAVTLLPALTHDCEYLVLAVSGFGLSGSNTSALLDILIDPAGGTSWSELISDLLCGFTVVIDYDALGNLGVPLMYHFPLWLPAGTSIGALARCAHGSAFANAPRVIAYAAGGNRNPASWWCGQRVETVGTFVAASSIGQAHTAAASVAITGAADNGSGLIRLTVASTTGMTTGDSVSVGGVGGTVEANGVWTITVISGTTFDLQGSTFANAYGSGGFLSRGVFSSWADLGSVTSARAGALQYSAQGPATAVTGRVYRFEFGAGSNQIGPCLYRGMGSIECGTHFFPGPVFCDIPAGAQMQVRAACGGTNPQGIDVSAYLVQ